MEKGLGNMIAQIEHNGRPVTFRHGQDSEDFRKEWGGDLGRPVTGSVSSSEVDRFLTKLNRLTSVDYETLKRRNPNEDLPTGFVAFRLYDAKTGDLLGGTKVAHAAAKPVNLHDIYFIALQSPYFEVTAWNGAVARSNSLPGCLDLELDIAILERLAMPAWEV